MKPLKFALPLLLALSLILSLSVSALALEEEPPKEEASTPPAICSLAELLTAIETAENGDTIVLQSKIVISENCTIGQEEKRITIIPADDFSGDTLFEIVVFEEQNIVMQNIILDGKEISPLSALSANFYTLDDIKGKLQLSNIQAENFVSGHSNIYLNALSATIEKCQFNNNTARRTAGIEIASTTSAEISDCTFSGNVSFGNGGALYCRGQAHVEDTDIVENQTVNPNSISAGGGIFVDDNASCEITGCQITDNTADVGGGIAVFGEAQMIDTLLYGNQGTKGASDIRSASGALLAVTYSNGMKSVYTDNDPIGFYTDDFENPFNAENNAIFLGEILTGAISSNQYGAKFIFADDLPPQEPAEPEPPIEPEPPDKPEDDTLPRPTPPSHPTHDYTPPVAQTEEPAQVKLSFGGAALDTENPIVLCGYGDGQLHEDDPITRAQITVLLYRSMTGESKATLSNGVCPFEDAPLDAWYYDAVAALSSADIISGCDGLFRPGDALTLGQLITLLTRFVEAKEISMPDNLSYTHHWAYSSIVTAIAYGWIENAEAIDPDCIVTRGEAVKFINSIFEVC